MVADWRPDISEALVGSRADDMSCNECTYDLKSTASLSSISPSGSSPFGSTTFGV